MSLEEYYIEILGRYRNEYQEKYMKKVVVKGKNGYENKINEPAWRETGKTVAEERKLLTNDSLYPSEVPKSIYTDIFGETIKFETKELRLKLENRAQDNLEDVNLDYGSVMSKFKGVFTKVLSNLRSENYKPEKNYKFILYAKVLFLFEFYGVLRKKDSMLCIDEGQDISLAQYRLLKKVNGEKLILNVYGDLNQQIPTFFGINTWELFSKESNAKIFTLNENYRNSDEIIKFYNNELKLNNLSLGIQTKEVEYLNYDDLITQIKLQLILQNRTAIIINDFTLISEEVKKYCEIGIISKAKASILSIEQVKGLEFDTAFVIEKDNMAINERYIAYTRALSQLFIVK
jgi:hypothetical protein